jgi:hypothetical protein
LLGNEHVFMLWSNPRLYNQKPRLARESQRTEFKELAKKELDSAKKT